MSCTDDVDDLMQLPVHSGGLRVPEKQYLGSLRPGPRRKVGALMRSTMRGRGIKAPLRFRVLSSRLPRRIKRHLFSEMGIAGESNKLNAYAEDLLKLPLGRLAEAGSDLTADKAVALRECANIMDSVMVGNDHVKRKALGMYNEWLHGGRTTFALALEGAPGIGKTTFVTKALVRAFGRPVVFINLGGAADVTFLSGHTYTYEGARYGRLAAGLIEAKVMNPIIYFDELDKVSNSARGDEIINTLIHLTDPAQNTHIRDLYFHSVDLDFSKCILVFSYNDPSRISSVLLDRLDRVQMSTPNATETMRVVREQMVPRALARFASVDIEVDDSALQRVCAHHKQDTGLRGVQRSIENIISAAAMCHTYGSTQAVGYTGGKDQNASTIDAGFAEHILQQHSRCTPPSPQRPSTMYT
jgi:ATP-dependent Lon protease